MARYQQGLLVSCQIPWDDKERVLEEIFRQQLRHFRRFYNHLYIFGTAGEGYAVDTARYQQIVQLFHEETRSTEAQPAVQTMVGVIGLSTVNIVERIAYAYDLGFRTFQISLPSWGALNDIEVMTFFKDVCGTFPEANFLHYNLPRTKRVLEAPDYRRLIDAIPNLVATKNTGGGLARVSSLMRAVPELQHFFGEINYAHGSLYGECSLLPSFGPMSPHKIIEYYEAGRTRQIEKLFAMQKQFEELVTDLLGRLLADARIDGTYDKILTRLGGLEEMPLRMLSPYQGYDEATYQECKRVLQTKYPEFVAPELAPLRS